VVTTVLEALGEGFSDRGQHESVSGVEVPTDHVQDNRPPTAGEAGCCLPSSVDTHGTRTIATIGSEHRIRGRDAKAPF